jgi:hypothetical protein
MNARSPRQQAPASRWKVGIRRFASGKTEAFSILSDEEHVFGRSSGRDVANCYGSSQCIGAYSPLRES